MRKIISVIAVVGCVFFGYQILLTKNLLEYSSECSSELNLTQKLKETSTEEERRAVATEMGECVYSKMNAVEKLHLSKDDLIRDATAAVNKQ